MTSKNLLTIVDKVNAGILDKLKWSNLTLFQAPHTT